MKPREYCCCAIPIVTAGIIAVLLEQLVLGILAGTLSIATPSSMYSWQTCSFIETDLPCNLVVGAVTPGAAKWIFAIVCYIGAGIQVLGFIAVSKVSTPSASPPQHATEH